MPSEHQAAKEAPTLSLGGQPGGLTASVFANTKSPGDTGAGQMTRECR